jgi:hypothetical protein
LGKLSTSEVTFFSKKTRFFHFFDKKCEKIIFFIKNRKSAVTNHLLSLLARTSSIATFSSRKIPSLTTHAFTTKKNIKFWFLPLPPNSLNRKPPSLAYFSKKLESSALFPKLRACYTSLVVCILRLTLLFIYNPRE